MKNGVIYKFYSAVKLKVTGKNIERFIRRLINHKIELLSINYINHKEVHIKIYKRDYDKIKEFMNIYDIDIVRTYGIIRIKEIFNLNRILFLFIILGIIFLIFLSNIIFNIKIIHNDKELRNLLRKELYLNGIKEKSFKKDYEELQRIKEKIIMKYKNKIEWLEIEIIGTTYVIRVQERKIPDIKSDIGYRNIVANRNAIIRNIEAEEGDIVKNINDYVKPGDVIISGQIKLYDDIKKLVKARGIVYGEVWYEVTVEYPLVYKESKLTGRSKKVFTFQFLNKTIELFNFKPFKNKKSNETIILESGFLPIRFYLDNQEEMNLIEELNTEEEAINKAISLAEKKIESKLNDNEYIINQNCLKVDIRNSTIKIDMFFAVYENITSYQKITEEPNEELEQE